MADAGMTDAEKTGAGALTKQDSHAPASHTVEEARTIDERASHCFGCGPSNPEGLHLKFEIDSADPEAITAFTVVELTVVHEGPPGHIHGGIIATLMDEAMSKLNRPLNLLAMTRNLEVEFLRPAPLHTPLNLRSRHMRREGRKVFHSAELSTLEGTLLARAKGFFLVVDPEMIVKIARDAAEKRS